MSGLSIASWSSEAQAHDLAALQRQGDLLRTNMATTPTENIPQQQDYPA